MTEDLHRNPRLQFGIRSMLLLILLASLPTAWIAYDVNKSRARAAVERTWNSRGAHVNFAPDRRIVWLGYRADTASGIGDGDLTYLKEAPDVEYLDLRDTAVTNAGLKKLHHLRQLQGVNLAGTRITDDGLRILEEMRQVRVLDVSRTNVTADGIQRFQLERQDCEIAHSSGASADAGLADNQ